MVDKGNEGVVRLTVSRRSHWFYWFYCQLVRFEVVISLRNDKNQDMHDVSIDGYSPGPEFWVSPLQKKHDKAAEGRTPFVQDRSFDSSHVLAHFSPLAVNIYQLKTMAPRLSLSWLKSCFSRPTSERLWVASALIIASRHIHRWSNFCRLDFTVRIYSRQCVFFDLCSIAYGKNTQSPSQRITVVVIDAW